MWILEFKELNTTEVCVPFEMIRYDKADNAESSELSQVLNHSQQGCQLRAGCWGLPGLDCYEHDWNKSN